MNTKSKAVEVAKEVAERDGDQIVTLAYGIRARVLPVSPTLVEEVANKIKDPLPPRIKIADEDREIENPDDPEYKRILEDLQRQRGVAAMDAFVMFGFELLDPLPETDVWLKKLKMLERRGQIDMSSYDLNDAIELEFLFKRYIGVNAALLSKVSAVSGISTEEVAQAEKSFQGNSSR